MYTILGILSLFVFIYSMVASRIERSVIFGPMIFVSFGYLVGPQIIILNAQTAGFQIYSVV